MQFPGLAAATATPAHRRGFREPLFLIGMEFFSNQMAGNFWLVYLVAPRSSLPFGEAIYALYLLFAGVIRLEAIAK